MRSSPPPSEGSRHGGCFRVRAFSAPRRMTTLFNCQTAWASDVRRILFGAGYAVASAGPEIQTQAGCVFLDSGFALSARPGMTLIGLVMPALVAGIHVFTAWQQRRGWPGLRPPKGPGPTAI